MSRPSSSSRWILLVCGRSARQTAIIAASVAYNLFLLSSYFPDFPTHLPTQMTRYDTIHGGFRYWLPLFHLLCTPDYLPAPQSCAVSLQFIAKQSFDSSYWPESRCETQYERLLRQPEPTNWICSRFSLLSVRLPSHRWLVSNFFTFSDNFTRLFSLTAFVPSISPSSPQPTIYPTNPV